MFYLVMVFFKLFCIFLYLVHVFKNLPLIFYKKIVKYLNSNHVNIQRDENICYNKDTEEKI